MSRNYKKELGGEGVRKGRTWEEEELGARVRMGRSKKELRGVRRKRS